MLIIQLIYNTTILQCVYKDFSKFDIFLNNIFNFHFPQQLFNIFQMDATTSAVQLSLTSTAKDSSSESTLFKPIHLGASQLGHRVVLAPLTRFRADKAHVPTDLHVEYYAQRASVPGTLLITEATLVSANAGGMNHIPGIWNEVQISGWKKVRLTVSIHPVSALT